MKPEIRNIMEALIRQGDQTYPTIVLDKANNRFEISGTSVPEDTETFYRPVIKWLDEYAKNPNDETNFLIKMDHLNVTSSKRILYILFKLNELIKKGKKVSISWHYREDDDDSLEDGHDFAFMVKIPFEFIKYRKGGAIIPELN